MGLIQLLNQKLQDLQCKYPLEYEILRNKYHIVINDSEYETKFIIKYRDLTRIRITECRYSKSTYYMISDTFENFNLHIRKLTSKNKYWFYIREDIIDSNIYQMISIFKELNLCVVKKSVNGNIHFIF